MKKRNIGLLFVTFTLISATISLSNTNNNHLVADENMHEVLPNIISVNDETYVKPIGRYYYDEVNEVTWTNFSGSGFIVNFYGTSLSVDYLATNANNGKNRPYLNVFIDGETDSDYARTVRVSQNRGELVLVDGLTLGYHEVKVMKRSSIIASNFGVKTIMTDGEFIAIDKTTNKLKIEFFGDSITCGHGVEGIRFEEDYETRIENAQKSYAYYAAEILDADSSLVSAGGFPLYKSMHTTNFMIDNIPDLFGAATFDTQTTLENYIPWDYNKFIPNVVVINLGTNDGSYFNTLEQDSAFFLSELNNFKSKYVGFLDKLFTSYGTDLKVVLMSDLIQNYDYINHAIDEVVASYKSDNVYRLQSQALKNVGGIMPGFGHPNKAQQLFAGDELAQLIADILDLDLVDEEGKIETKSYQFSGISNKIVKFGETLDLLENVRLTGLTGEDLTDQIKLDLQSLVLYEGRANSVGTHAIRYYYELNGKIVAQKYCYVTVQAITNDVIVNGDFTYGESGWKITTGSMSVIDNVAHVKGISNTLEQSPLSLVKNINYRLSVTAKGADTNLDIEVLVGKQNLLYGLTTSFTLGADYETFNLIFASAVTSNNVELRINATNDYTLSNVSFEKVNLTGDQEAPVFKGIYEKELLVGMTLNMKDGIKLTDNIDTTISYEIYDASYRKIESALQTFNEAGTFRFIYEAVDKAGNETSVVRTIYVRETINDNYNQILNGDFTNDDALWYTDNWGSAQATYNVINERFHINISKPGEATTSDPFPRVIYGNVPGNVSNRGLILERGSSYVLKFSASASVARPITVIIANVLEESPWLNYYGQNQGTIINLTVDYREYTIKFTVNEQLDTTTEAALLFALGYAGVGSSVAALIEIGNVSLRKDVK